MNAYIVVVSTVSFGKHIPYALLRKSFRINHTMSSIEIYICYGIYWTCIETNQYDNYVNQFDFVSARTVVMDVIG